MKAFLTAGLALATCAAFAAITKQDFAGTTAGESPSGAPWYGDGGKYAAKTSGSNDMVLAIEGSMICSNATAAADSEFVKTSFKVKAPEEGMATADLPTGEEVAGCQIAVATGEAGTGDDADKLKVMVYAGSAPAWTDAGLKVSTNDWFVVTLSFDYSGATKTAKVQIGNAVAGPFTLVTSPASTTAKINSLNFVGSASLDDVLIDEALPKSSMTDGLAGLQGLTVYTNEVGMTLAEIEASTKGSGGLTAAERIQAGLSATDGAASFTATAISTDAQNKLGITVPYARDNGQVYTVVMTADGTTTRTVVSPEIGVNQATLKVNPPSGAKVIKLAVDVGAPASSND